MQLENPTRDPTRDPNSVNRQKHCFIKMIGESDHSDMNSNTMVGEKYSGYKKLPEFLLDHANMKKVAIKISLYAIAGD